MNTGMSDIAKRLYDHARGAGAAHGEAIERALQALAVISPESTAEALSFTRDVLQSLARTQEPPAVMQGASPFDMWFDASMKAGWVRWRRYRRYLIESKRWAFDSVSALDASSDEIVKHLGNPRREDPFDRRGLVAGSVQSGKTASYMALMCKALDAGYGVVVVLAGIHNSLRHQTQTRIDEEVIGLSTRLGATGLERVGVGKMELEPGQTEPVHNFLTARGENGDFSVQVARRVGVHVGATPLLLVVKKNALVLENLVAYLRSLPVASRDADGIAQIRGVPFLLIDDEADQASINFRAVRDEADQLVQELDPSRVNEQIRALLMTFTHRTYVGYTATPFANVLINPELDHPTLGPDLFPRDFIVALHPPDDYIGPRQVFGTAARSDGTDDPGMPVVRVVNDAQAFLPERHRQDHVPGELPASLREAILGYILAGAIRCCRSQDRKHHSMLVHVTRFTAVQERVGSALDTLRKRLLSILEYGSGMPGTLESREALLGEFRALWDRDMVPTSAAMNETLPGWAEVETQLLPCLRRASIRLINGDAGDVLDYEQHRETGAWVIAVGGDKLSRGLTLEGLTVSYYLRASRTYDTLMQMGRWFGYRPGYADVCRIFTSAELVSWFQHIVMASEALWDEFESMQRMASTPSEFGLRILAHPAMEVTSPLKMQEAERINLSYSGTVQETITFDRTPTVIQANQGALDAFTQLLGAHEVRTDGTGPYLWRGVPAASIVAFLRDYRTHPLATTVIASRMAEYIELHASNGVLASWTVALLSARRPMPGAATGAAGGLEVQRFQRAILDGSSVERTRIRRLLSPDDELLDLDEAELGALDRLRPDRTRGSVTAQDARGYDLEGPPLVRIGRPPSRGLLILYPLALGPRGSDMRGITTVWGMALSFPRSRLLTAHQFVVNPVWREQWAD